MTPGATPLTLIPNSASKLPKERIKPFIACFAATYIGEWRLPSCPAILVTITTRLGLVGETLSIPLFKKWLMANCVVRIGCVTFMSRLLYLPVVELAFEVHSNKTSRTTHLHLLHLDFR